MNIKTNIERETQNVFINNVKEEAYDHGLDVGGLPLV